MEYHLAGWALRVARFSVEEKTQWENANKGGAEIKDENGT